MARDKEDVNKQKESTLKRLFEDDWMLLHIDTRTKDIVVPEHLRGLSSITFKLSRLFQGATEFGTNKISAQLLFGTNRHECSFPYDSIWGVTSVKGSNIVWPESAPQEILAQMEKGALENTQQQSTTPAPTMAAENPALEKKKTLQKGHLKRIK